MTVEIKYDCYNERAVGPFPDPYYICCGWCYNYPRYFYGTWGPLRRAVIPSACTNIPLVSQPLTLTRTGECPSFSWGPVGLFLTGSLICPKMTLGGDEFKAKWHVPNCFDLTGYCGPDANGTVQFYCTGTILYPCEYQFEITSWSY